MKPPAILVTSYPGDSSVEELARLAADDVYPRRNYVELQRRTGGVVVDADHMEHRALPLARWLSRRHMPSGQVLEAFLRRREYGGLLAWADRLGLPLALLLKLTFGRRDMVLVSVLLTNAKKALPFRLARLQTHMAAIVCTGTRQLEILETRFRVPRAKLHFGEQTTDERFWSSDGVAPPPDGPVVSVGWEARDYPTLLRAVEGLDVPVELAIGSIAQPEHGGGMSSPLGEVPPNVTLHSSLKPRELRELYRRARLVVLPLHDVEFDAGTTALLEALSMGRPVVVTRSRGQGDVVEDGVQGVYVPPADVAAMREAVERLAGDPEELARMGAAGRELIERRHRLDFYVEQLARLLEGGRAYQ